MTRVMARSSRPADASGHEARFTFPDFNRSPFLVIWEVTRACALACVHCRADAIHRRDPRELTTDEAFRLIDQVRGVRRAAAALRADRRRSDAPARSRRAGPLRGRRRPDCRADAERNRGRDAGAARGAERGGALAHRRQPRRSRRPNCTTRFAACADRTAGRCGSSRRRSISVCRCRSTRTISRRTLPTSRGDGGSRRRVAADALGAVLPDPDRPGRRPRADQRPIECERAAATGSTTCR